MFRTDRARSIRREYAFNSLEVLEPRWLLSTATAASHQPFEMRAMGSSPLSSEALVHKFAVSYQHSLHRIQRDLRMSPGQATAGRGHSLLNHSILSQRDILAVAASISDGPIGGYTPQQIQSAYGLGGIANQGKGMTIAIVDAYDDPNIFTDVSVFSAQYGLPQMNGANGNPTLTKYFPQGSAKPDAGWSIEIALDVEWAHAIAPNANIDLVEAHDSGYNLDLADPYAAALPGVVVVSNSWGGSETRSELQSDSLFMTPAGHAPVVFTASSGDLGNPGGYPAYSPNVVAVGGTSLFLSASGQYGFEAGWSGAGGGISSYELSPAYQANNGVLNYNGANSFRSIPDVSMVADPDTGVAVYDSYRASGWTVVGGTSLASPAFGAIVAIADQARAQHGLLPLDSQASDPNSILAKMYAAYASPNYHSVFHDVTSGSNGYNAGVGYDLVTGLGTPNGVNLIALLASS